ncbi:putative glycosyltransferase [Magnetospirillum sp. LM-5]|uniref:glycosyltransferase n=1 Tax=Magnetospirillum sp. LM-5 TaxID=2681466 RepID=UPI0013860020|nr:glycosyltransferase [Magnetospirillum sp. LM-5]CAA7619985.1 putative glycosyltransferase [Magnetospirillum sp. LM-5]
MHITLVDDSIPFDGYTASARPLGGAEKAFAALPGALARRGHTVAVYNRCRWSMFIEGAQWETFEGRRPLTTDVLIAFRKPALLEFVRQARKRVLWHTIPGRFLDRKDARAMLDNHKPLVLLCSEAQAVDWKARGLAVGLLPPALKSDFLNPAQVELAEVPRAIVTSHPRHGLDWLVDLWVERIHPAVPAAELHIHSMALAAAAEGGGIEPALESLAAKVFAASAQNVRVERPQGDHLMAQAFQQAWLHLYPGHPDDSTAFTLMESQAAGCPAVIRPLGAAPERVADGRSAYVAPDSDAFANLASTILGNPSVRASLSAEARALYGGRTWDAAAERLEAFLA